MSMETFFFATRSDVFKGLKEIELAWKIKYIKRRAYDSQDYMICDSIDNFDNFGINTSGDHQSESYLVLDNSIPAIAREVKQSTGGVKYFIDQMENKSSIVFWPGGLYETDYLICGHIATLSDDKASQELYKYFTKIFIKGYKKIGRYYVGIEAIEMAKKLGLLLWV